jgi:hypothetical protein
LLDRLQNALHERERVLLAPLLRALPALANVVAVDVELVNSFLLCRISDRSEVRCPFEAHFGRDREEGRFNFFFGLGAELYNYALLDDPATYSDMATDVLAFLTSKIDCELHCTRKGTIRAIYLLSNWVVNGEHVRFVYRNHAWPVFRYESRVLKYAPWLE